MSISMRMRHPQATRTLESTRGENITKWTKDALLGIGLKAGDLLKPADGGA